MKRIKAMFRLIIFYAALNTGVTVGYDYFENPILTVKQVILRIPQTFFWDFSN